MNQALLVTRDQATIRQVMEVAATVGAKIDLRASTAPRDIIGQTWSAIVIGADCVDQLQHLPYRPDTVLIDTDPNKLAQAVLVANTLVGPIPFMALPQGARHLGMFLAGQAMVTA